MISMTTPIDANIVTPVPAALSQKGESFSTMYAPMMTTGTSSSMLSMPPHTPIIAELTDTMTAVHAAALTGPT